MNNDRFTISPVSENGIENQGFQSDSNTNGINGDLHKNASALNNRKTSRVHQTSPDRKFSLAQLTR